MGNLEYFCSDKWELARNAAGGKVGMETKFAGIEWRLRRSRVCVPVQLCV